MNFKASASVQRKTMLSPLPLTYRGVCYGSVLFPFLTMTAASQYSAARQRKERISMNREAKESHMGELIHRDTETGESWSQCPKHCIFDYLFKM